MASCIISLSLKVIRLLNKIAKRVVNAMNPSPPTSIKSIITTWPNSFQYVPVSNVTSPVTHTAEVAVKSELKNL